MTVSRQLKRRQQADPDFSKLCFDSRMAGTKRKTTRPGANRKPLSKSSLLPMPSHSARELSLAHHLALVACRSDNGSRHQINELVRSVYMAYNLQRMGFGDIPFECYEHAEAALENTAAVAAKSGKWILSEQDAPVIERLLSLHDKQLAEAPLRRVVAAERQLRQFLAGAGASPLVRPKLD
jgi:hypothetical protein